MNNKLPKPSTDRSVLTQHLRDLERPNISTTPVKPPRVITKGNLRNRKLMYAWLAHTQKVWSTRGHCIPQALQAGARACLADALWALDNNTSSSLMPKGAPRWQDGWRYAATYLLSCRPG